MPKVSGISAISPPWRKLSPEKRIVKWACKAALRA
jgi:hypothetical protein